MDGYINKRTLKQEIALAFDYDTRKKINPIIDRIKEVNLLDRDIGKEPVLESRTTANHVMYADGKCGFERRNYEDWMCPTCGWFVGELYSGFGQWHIQGETSYCARCGQKIDWSLPKEEEKQKYEERKRLEREKFEATRGCKLDNMNEGKREKYGMLGRKDE